MTAADIRLRFGPYLLGAILAVSLAGCGAHYVLDQSQQLTVFAQGSRGPSNYPVEFASPVVALRIPYSILRPGYFVVRHDRYTLKDVFVLHQLIERKPDGTWVMQGANRKTNPAPDKHLLTPQNFVGIVIPIAATETANTDTKNTP